MSRRYLSLASLMVAALLAGCAGSTSEITPASSSASEKSLRVTPAAKRKYKLTITMPEVPTVAAPTVEGGGK